MRLRQNSSTCTGKHICHQMKKQSKFTFKAMLTVAFNIKGVVMGVIMHCFDQMNTRMQECVIGEEEYIIEESN